MTANDPFKLTRAEKVLICSCSIERVINTSVHLIKKSKLTDEDVGVNLLDWKDLKQLVVKLWNRERNDIFKRKDHQNDTSP